MDELCERAGPDGAVVFFLGRLWAFEELEDAEALLGTEVSPLLQRVTVAPCNNNEALN